MIISVQDDIKEFFEKYEKYFQELNFKEQAKLFSNPMVAADPNGIAHHKNNFLTRMFYAWGMSSFYKKAQMTTIRIISLEQNSISYEYAIVKVCWGATFKKTSSKVIKFDISYLVSSTKGKPEIIMFISHESEQKALREHGILK